MPNEMLSAEPSHAIHHLNDPATGLRGYIAIHSRARGPAFGGCRLWRYATEDEALLDARRLAEGMTYKNALADLPFGGGKAVLMRPDPIRDRREYFRAFGRAVEALHGGYVTAEDVGTTAQDMEAVHEETRHVSGISRMVGFGGDPSRFTALGVFLAIQEAVRMVLRRDSLKGVRVAIQGVGAVGARLCGELARAEAELWIADSDPARAQVAAELWDAKVVAPEQVLDQRVHVLAPCAMGGILDARAVARIRAPIVAGAANNQLASPEIGDRLHERGIWYLPDFLVNAGGIIAVAHEHLRTGDEGMVLDDVARIADRAQALIAEVRRADEPPARVALAWAKARISGKGTFL